MSFQYENSAGLGIRKCASKPLRGVQLGNKSLEFGEMNEEEKLLAGDFFSFFRATS